MLCATDVGVVDNDDIDHVVVVSADDDDDDPNANIQVIYLTPMCITNKQKQK